VGRTTIAGDREKHWAPAAPRCARAARRFWWPRLIGTIYQDRRPINSPTALTRAEDTLAIDIYRRAEESGEEISLGTVERRLSELQSHEPGCCDLCTAAAGVQPYGVWLVVNGVAARRISDQAPGAALGPGGHALGIGWPATPESPPTTTPGRPGTLAAKSFHFRDVFASWGTRRPGGCRR
jgi:hypothetical protein